MSPLPAELGDGFVAYDEDEALDQPYYVISRFSCGDKTPWIDLELSRVQKGRDHAKDLIDLMRVAQKRYGEWKNCTPEPPSDQDTSGDK